MNGPTVQVRDPLHQSQPETETAFRPGQRAIALDERVEDAGQEEQAEIIVRDTGMGIDPTLRRTTSQLYVYAHDPCRCLLSS